MKYYILYRENNNFDDVLSDTNIKKLLTFKIRYHQHLILGSEDIPNDLQSYLVLKYGDDVKAPSDIFIDRKPIPFVDYTPDKNRPSKYKKL